MKAQTAEEFKKFHSVLEGEVKKIVKTKTQQEKYSTTSTKLKVTGFMWCTYATYITLAK